MKLKKLTVLSIGLISILSACGGSTNISASTSVDSTNSLGNSIDSTITSSETSINSENNSTSSNSSSNVTSSSKPSNSESSLSVFEDNASNEIVSGTQTESVNIVNYGGHLETAFAEFYPVKNASLDNL